MFPSPFCDGILRKTRNHQAERLGLCERRSLHALRVMCFAHKAQPQNQFCPCRAVLRRDFLQEKAWQNILD